MSLRGTPDAGITGMRWSMFLEGLAVIGVSALPGLAWYAVARFAAARRGDA